MVFDGDDTGIFLICFNGISLINNTVSGFHGVSMGSTPNRCTNIISFRKMVHLEIVYHDLPTRKCDVL